MPPVNDTLAILALVLCIIVPVVGWLLGIVLGHISNHQAKAAGRRRSGLAIAAVVLGYAAVVIVAIVAIVWVAGQPASPDPTQQFINCLNNAINTGQDPSVACPSS